MTEFYTLSRPSYNEGLINKLVLENLKHRPIRTLLVVFAIAVQVNMMLTLVGMSYGMLNDFQERSRGVGADIIVRGPSTSVLSMSAPSMKEAMVGYLREQPHVTDAIGVTIHSMEGFLNSVTGIDLNKLNQFSGGFTFKEGGPWTKPTDVIVDEHYATQRKLKVNGPVKMMNKEWRVAGIIGSGKMSHVFMPIDILQDLTGNTGKFSQIYLKVDDPKKVEEIVEQLKLLPGLKDSPIYSMNSFTSLISIDNAPGLRPFQCDCRPQYYRRFPGRLSQPLYSGAGENARDRNPQKPRSNSLLCHPAPLPRNHFVVRPGRHDGYRPELRKPVVNPYLGARQPANANCLQLVAYRDGSRHWGFADRSLISGLQGSPPGCNRGARL